MVGLTKSLLAPSSLLKNILCHLMHLYLHSIPLIWVLLLSLLLMMQTNEDRPGPWGWCEWLCLGMCGRMSVCIAGRECTASYHLSEKAKIKDLGRKNKHEALVLVMISTISFQL